MAHRSHPSRDKDTREKDQPRGRAPEPRSPTPPPPAPPPPAPLVWRRHALPLFVLWSLALLAYANSFRSGLVFDNSSVLAHDTRITQATAANANLILTQSYWYQNTTSVLYRPLTTFSYLFNYAVLGNGIRPEGYHAINFLLHATNIALVYLLGLVLLSDYRPAFAMAALWALHPVLTESVTNIVGRADLLAAFGVLAGLLCYARGVATGGRGALRWWGALVVVASVGCFAKESGVVVVAAVFFYDLSFCRQAPLRTRLSGYAAAALPVAVYLLVRDAVISKLPIAPPPMTDNPLVGADFLTGRLTAVKVLGRYLWLLVWPQHLSADYSYNQIPLLSWRFNTWEDWQVPVALAVCAGALVLAAWCYRRARPVCFLIALFFAALAPTANLALLVGTIMAERFLYLPSVGFAGCLAWAGWAGYQRLSARGPAARLLMPASLAVLCLAFGGRTFARNNDWLDEVSLWRASARACPDSYKTHQHLAPFLKPTAAPGEDAAQREIGQALAILQPLPDEEKVTAAYSTAGYCYRLKGDAVGAPAAAEWYRKARDVLELGRRVDAATGEDLMRRNRLEGKTIFVTGWAPLYLELGRVYGRLGEYQKALDGLEAGRQLDPKAEFFEEMAATFSAQGHPEQASIALMEGLVMNASDQVRLAAEVVDLYRKAEPGSCALTGTGPAASLNFECPRVHGQLCLAGRNVANLYHRMHRDNDAIATATSAVRGLGCPVELFR